MQLHRHGIGTGNQADADTRIAAAILVNKTIEIHGIIYFL